MLDTTARLDRQPIQVAWATCDFPWRDTASAPPDLWRRFALLPVLWIPVSLNVFDIPGRRGGDRFGDSVRCVCAVGTTRGWILEETATEATDHFTSQIQKHHAYLQGLVEAGLISSDLEDTAMSIWWRLCDAVGGKLAVPDAAPGGDGELLYIWKRDNHYLSLEMTEEGAEFFYQDRSTGAIWGAPYDHLEEGVPSEIVAKLGLFPGDL